MGITGVLAFPALETHSDNRTKGDHDTFPVRERRNLLRNRVINESQRKMHSYHTKPSRRSESEMERRRTASEGTQLSN